MSYLQNLCLFSRLVATAQSRERTPLVRPVHASLPTVALHHLRVFSVCVASELRFCCCFFFFTFSSSLPLQKTERKRQNPPPLFLRLASGRCSDKLPPVSAELGGQLRPFPPDCGGSCAGSRCLL